LVYGNPNFLTHQAPTFDSKAPLFFVKSGNSSQNFSLEDINRQNQEFRSSNNIKDDDSIVVGGDLNSPTLFAYGIYNTYLHGNFVNISGLNFKDAVGKLSI